MNELQKRRKGVRLPPVPPGQISITFESTALFGLMSAERIKAVIRLARLPMLAAGVAPEERDDEC